MRYLFLEANDLGQLTEAHTRWGPATSVIYHDSEFLMQKPWLEAVSSLSPACG